MIGAKLNWRQTSVLFVTVAPGTRTHVVPLWYSTWKFRSPYWVNVMLGVGGLGEAKLSCTVNTSISSIVC